MLQADSTGGALLSGLLHRAGPPHGVISDVSHQGRTGRHRRFAAVAVGARRDEVARIITPPECLGDDVVDLQFHLGGATTAVSAGVVVARQDLEP